MNVVGLILTVVAMSAWLGLDIVLTRRERARMAKGRRDGRRGVLK